MKTTVSQGIAPGKTGLERNTEKSFIQIRDAADMFGQHKIFAQTSDATAKTVWSEDMPENTTWRVQYLVEAQDTAGNVARYHETKLVRRGAGSPTVKATITVEGAYEDVAAWGFTFTAAASGTISLSVTGAAATSITWQIYVAVFEVA
jgi:hypothetical protein